MNSEEQRLAHWQVLMRLLLFSANLIGGIVVVQFGWVNALGVCILMVFNFSAGYVEGAAGFVRYGIEHGYRVIKDGRD